VHEPRRGGGPGRCVYRVSFRLNHVLNGRACVKPARVLAQEDLSTGGIGRDFQMPELPHSNHIKCVSTQGDAEALEPAVCTARSRLQLALHAQRDPLRDEIREGQGALARRHTDGPLCVTTRPYDARRDAPPPQRTTRHNERSSETEGICPLFTLLLFLKSGTCNTWYLPVTQDSILFPPIIGNLNIATISHLASLSPSTSSLFH
jgi:hypothetical protein